jgi:3'-5' exoribonuclease
MRRLFLRDCQAGDVVEDVFVIANKQIAATQTNKNYIKCFVSDRTGQLNARMWNATRDIFNALPESGFVRIRGRIENYQNNLQFIIEQCWPAKDGTYDAGDLIASTSRNVERMCARVHEILGSIQNRHLAALVQAYLDDEPLMLRFCRAPAAMSFHHAFLGGLLEHTLNAMEVGNCVCAFYPGLNRDLVISGIFLHDIAKTWELTYDCAFGYSDSGQLVGHIVKSAMWVEHKAREAERTLGEKIPQPLIDVLQHIILSHHGELSKGFGSAKSPATPEAMMVSFIDDMDAKLMLALQSTRGTVGPGAGEASSGDGEGATGAGGSWTEYIKAFNGRLYRPDVAPADAQDGGPVDSLPSANGANGDAVSDVPPPTLKLAITNPLFESAKPRR